MTMELDKKAFQERLHKCLDGHLPPKHDDRVEAFAEIFKMSSIKAEKILDGKLLPSEDEMRTIADEFEIDISELTGRNQKPFHSP